MPIAGEKEFQAPLRNVRDFREFIEFHTSMPQSFPEELHKCCGTLNGHLRSSFAFPVAR